MYINKQPSCYGLRLRCGSKPTSSPAHLFAIRGRRKKYPETLQTHD